MCRLVTWYQKSRGQRRAHATARAFVVFFHSWLWCCSSCQHCHTAPPFAKALTALAHCQSVWRVRWVLLCAQITPSSFGYLHKYANEAKARDAKMIQGNVKIEPLHFIKWVVIGKMSQCFCIHPPKCPWLFNILRHIFHAQCCYQGLYLRLVCLFNWLPWSDLPVNFHG